MRSNWFLVGLDGNSSLSPSLIGVWWLVFVFFLVDFFLIYSVVVVVILLLLVCCVVSLDCSRYQMRNRERDPLRFAFSRLARALLPYYYYYYISIFFCIHLPSISRLSLYKDTKGIYKKETGENNNKKNKTQQRQQTYIRTERKRDEERIFWKINKSKTKNTKKEEEEKVSMKHVSLFLSLSYIYIDPVWCV
jgi:hypothetical protein